MYGDTQRIFPEKPKYLHSHLRRHDTPDSTRGSEEHLQPAERGSAGMRLARPWEGTCMVARMRVSIRVSVCAGGAGEPEGALSSARKVKVVNTQLKQLFFSWRLKFTGR